MPALDSRRESKSKAGDKTTADSPSLNTAPVNTPHIREMLAKGMEMLKEAQDERAKRRGIGRHGIQELAEQRAQGMVETTNKFFGRLAKGSSNLEKVLKSTNQVSRRMTNTKVYK